MKTGLEEARKRATPGNLIAAPQGQNKANECCIALLETLKKEKP